MDILFGIQQWHQRFYSFRKSTIIWTDKGNKLLKTYWKRLYMTQEIFTVIIVTVIIIIF